MMLSSIKCRAAEAWIKDVLFPADDKPWEVEHTPIPELDPDTMAVVSEQVQAEAMQWQMEAQQLLPPEALQERMRQIRDQLQERMQEEADKLAGRMDDKINDQCIEGHWEDAMKEVIKDVVTYPLGCLKGPVVRRRRTLKWEQGQDGSWQPVKGFDYKLEWYRVAPFDLYPSPSSKTPQDGYLFERHRLRRADLVAMKGVPGYNDAAIDLVLEAVDRARSRPSSLQGQADRLVAWFLPVVNVTALITYVAWTAIDSGMTGLLYAIAVLLVACPSALGLATPLVLWVAFSRLAGRGLLVENADSIEALAAVDPVVFDKTGTLT